MLLMCSLPKDRTQLEQEVQKWIFGDNTPSTTPAKDEPVVQSSALPAQPQSPPTSAASQTVPTPTTADSVASSVSNLSISEPRELTFGTRILSNKSCGPDRPWPACSRPEGVPSDLSWLE